MPRRSEPYNSAKLIARLDDGRDIPVMVRNFGWNAESGTYETEWEFDGITARSSFETGFHGPQFCRHPNVRFCYDYESLEIAITNHFKSDLSDLIEE
jgi:hypothetical protein